MKIFILFLILLISPIELRRHEEDDEDMYELSDLLKDQFDRHRHRPNPPIDLEDANSNENGDDQDYSPSFQRIKTHPSRKKVLPDIESDNEDVNTNDVTTRITTSSSSKTMPVTKNSQDDISDSSVCIDKYDVKPEQLVKVKELTNGARMIRYVLVDKRTLPSGVTVKDSCMSDCCAEKSCDLAMLSEQPTHNGYKCYLFACNGSCVLAAHQDYTIMTLKTNSILTKGESIITSSTPATINIPRKTSFFREVSVIIFLVFGLVSTIILFALLCCHCRHSSRRGLRFKNYSVDEDYLINGL